MNTNSIYIKNMVCPRCITTVESIFKELRIDYSSVQLGEIQTTSKISQVQKIKLGDLLVKNGFELLEDNKSKLIGQIKATIVDEIHYQTENLKVNFSILLSEKLNQEYTMLSKLFSSVEGITIERFIVKQKMEKVKELLFYNQLSLSEIAFQMNYSSVAHLSAQFKKETGMTPSTFKLNGEVNRNFLDKI